MHDAPPVIIVQDLVDARASRLSTICFPIKQHLSIQVVILTVLRSPTNESTIKLRKSSSYNCCSFLITHNKYHCLNNCVYIQERGSYKGADKGTDIVVPSLTGTLGILTCTKISTLGFTEA